MLHTFQTPETMVPRTSWEHRDRGRSNTAVGCLGPPPHASPWAERWVEWHGRPSGGPAPSPLTSHVFNGAVQHEVEERVKAFQDPTGL